MLAEHFPSAPFRTGRAAFTASGSPVSLWVVSVKANTAPGGAVHVVVGRQAVKNSWFRLTASLEGSQHGVV